MGNYSSLQILENLRRGRQPKNFTTNVPKILDLKSSSERIFSENCRWVPLFFASSQLSRRTCAETLAAMQATTVISVGSNYISPSASTCRSPRVFYCFNVHLLVAVIRYSAKIFEQFSKVIHVLLKRLFYSVVNSNYSYSEYMKLAFFLCIFLTVDASKTFQLLSNHKVT